MGRVVAVGPPRVRGARHCLAGVAAHPLARNARNDLPVNPLPPHFNHVQAVCKSLLRSCKSMGVHVVPRPEDA